MKRVVSPVMALALVAALALALLTAAAQPAQAGKSRMVSGWFGYWTSANEMIRIAKSSGGTLGEVNIFWWSWQGASKPLCTFSSNGTCTSSSSPWTTSQFNAARKGLQALGIDVYATHTDLSYSKRGTLSSFLSTRKNRKKIAKQMANWAANAGVDGVDLDWENFAFNDGSGTWSATKPRLTKTIKQLSKHLHAKGKKLSVTVPGGYAPFRNGKPNPGGGYWVYDWKALAPYVDRLRLMAYDYSWNRPGPIGPHGWASEVARSAALQVGSAHKHKIYIGVHSYGKAWYDRDANDGYITSGTCKTNWVPSGPNSVGLNPDSALSLARSYGTTARFNSAHKEWTFRYLKSEPGTFRSKKGKTKKQTCNVWKEVWTGATETAVGRAQIVNKFGLGGLAVWQLASTQSDFYSKLRPYAKSGGGNSKPSPGWQVGVSNSRPVAGSTIQLTGRLAGLKQGKKVKRQLRVNGKWVVKSRKRADANGRVTFSISLASGARDYQFRIKGGGKKSKVVTVKARPRPKISFTRSTSQAGAPIKFKVRVTPAAKNQRVTRQLKRNGKWVTKQVATTNAKGKAVLRTSLYDKPQKYRFRVVVGASTRTAAGTSRVMKFRSR